MISLQVSINVNLCSVQCSVCSPLFCVFYLFPSGSCSLAAALNSSHVGSVCAAASGVSEVLFGPDELS